MLTPSYHERKKKRKEEICKQFLNLLRKKAFVQNVSFPDSQQRITLLYEVTFEKHVITSVRHRMTTKSSLNNRNFVYDELYEDWPFEVTRQGVMEQISNKRKQK